MSDRQQFAKNVMRILIITQKIDQNDGVLSFMIGWIRQFANECEQVTVIALYVGEHDLPSSVKVLSLGKESGVSRLKYLSNFFKFILSERNNYDSVFVHMNQVYVILGGVIWRLMGKKIALWYAHGAVPWDLRIAEGLTNVIIASTPSGFRLKTKKLHLIGQGINTDLFLPLKRSVKVGQPIKLLIVGRVSPSKDLATLVYAVKLLVDKNYKVTLDVVGGAGTPQQEGYFKDIRSLSHELGLESIVTFHGARPHNETVAFFNDADIFVSTAINGSFDKAMGDAMATALPLVACNVAMAEVLGDLKSRLMFEAGNVEMLVARLEPLLSASDEERNVLGRSLRAIIVRDHSLKKFIAKIVTLLR